MFWTERCWAKFELMKELLVFVEVDCLHSQSVIVRGQRAKQVHCRIRKEFRLHDLLYIIVRKCYIHFSTIE